MTAPGGMQSARFILTLCLNKLKMYISYKLWCAFQDASESGAPAFPSQQQDDGKLAGDPYRRRNGYVQPGGAVGPEDTDQVGMGAAEATWEGRALPFKVICALALPK